MVRNTGEGEGAWRDLRRQLRLERTRDVYHDRQFAFGLHVGLEHAAHEAHGELDAEAQNLACAVLGPRISGARPSCHG